MKIERCLLIVAAVIIFLVPSCNTIANHAPIITGLTVEREVVFPSASCQIECFTWDEDDNGLSYEWSASGGSIEVDGPAATWIAPVFEGTYRITVEATDDNGGEAIDSLTITVRGNQPLTITSLTADADWVTPMNSQQIECVVSDPNNDNLSYEWSASGGDISGTGSVVTWTAPEAIDIYDITVKVIDDLGNETMDSLSIGVAPNHSPTIEELVVTPEEPKYVRELSWASWEYRIYRGERCEIECIASDIEDDELSYEWSADEGNILAEGSTITWTAPHQEDKVTVAVTVSDSSGDTATDRIVFNVECSKCLFK